MNNHANKNSNMNNDRNEMDDDFHYRHVNVDMNNDQNRVDQGWSGMDGVEAPDSPPYYGWNAAMAEEELDYEPQDEVISISSSDEAEPAQIPEEPIRIREEPEDYEEWGEQEWIEMGDEEPGEDEPEGAGEEVPPGEEDQPDLGFGIPGEGAEEWEQPPENEQPNTQYFQNWRAEVQEVGDVRMAHIQLDLWSRIVLSRDRQMATTDKNPQPEETPDEEPIITSPPPTPGRWREGFPEASSPGRFRSPTPEMEWTDEELLERPPTPGRRRGESPEVCSPTRPRSPMPDIGNNHLDSQLSTAEATTTPETLEQPPSEHFDSDDPSTWPNEIQELLANLQEEYLLAERTGRTRVKMVIGKQAYRLRTDANGNGRVDKLEK